MTTVQIFDAAGAGLDMSPGLPPLGSDIEEVFVAEESIGGGYFVGETSISGVDLADSAFYLYFFDSFTQNFVYERIEAYLDGVLTLSLSDFSVTNLAVVQQGIDAFVQGNDVLIGNRFDDRIFGSTGDDVINGAGGVDTAAYSGRQSSFTLTLSPQSTTISDRRFEGQGTDTLRNIEFLDFSTDLLGEPFDLRQFGGPTSLTGAELESFIELYIAYFNRAPDAIGLNFWGTSFANGTSLEEMAALFVQQPETLATYPPGTSNEVFATSVYNNVLGRTPDQAGIDFWVGLLDSGGVGRDAFILRVLEGAKAPLKPEEGQAFVDQQLADRAYLESKTDIGAYFAVHKGMSDVENAAEAMALFDGSASSIDLAVSAIDAFYEDALDPVNGEFLMPVVGVLDDPFSIA